MISKIKWIGSGIPLTQIDEGYVSGRVFRNSFMYDHKYETNIVRLQSEINNLIDYFGLSDGFGR